MFFALLAVLGVGFYVARKKPAGAATSSGGASSAPGSGFVPPDISTGQRDQGVVPLSWNPDPVTNLPPAAPGNWFESRYPNPIPGDVGGDYGQSGAAVPANIPTGPWDGTGTNPNALRFIEAVTNQAPTVTQNGGGPGSGTVKWMPL